MPTDILLIYSGGLDSSVLLYYLRERGHQVATLGIHYGQRHSQELIAARQLTQALGVPFQVADLRAINPLLAGSSQTDARIAVPKGHYADDSMRATIVPNRNMIMLAVAAAAAISKGIEQIAYAAHAGDHPIYPDCRPEFAQAMQIALELCHNPPGITLRRPFIELTKAEIVELGASLDVPFAQTWSCYEGRAVHCGTCGTCVERREAFFLAGEPDPTLYEGS